MLDHEMTIVPQSFEKNFTIYSRHTAQDSSLSWGAKGLLFYLLSLPENWKIQIDQLAEFYTGDRQKGIGRDAIYEMIRELRKKRYILFKRIQQPDGKFKFIYVVFHTPYSDDQIKKMFPFTDNPEEDPAHSEKPLTDYPDTVNPEDNKVYRNKEPISKEKQQQQHIHSSDPPIPPDKAVVVVSSEKKIVSFLEDIGAPAELIDIALRYDLSRIEDAVGAYNQRLEMGDIDNAFGFLRSAIEKGWKPNKKIPTVKKAEVAREEYRSFNFCVYREDSKNIEREFLEVKSEYPNKNIYTTTDSIVFVNLVTNIETKIGFDDPEFKRKMIETKKKFKNPEEPDAESD